MKIKKVFKKKTKYNCKKFIKYIAVTSYTKQRQNRWIIVKTPT